MALIAKKLAHLFVDGKWLMDRLVLVFFRVIPCRSVAKSLAIFRLRLDLALFFVVDRI